MTTYDVDVVVVGLGPGGEHAAQRLAEAGLDVVGVERGLVGGECPFYGCIPSKLVIRAAGTLAEARRVGELAGEADVRPDWSVVARRIAEDATRHWTDDSHVEALEGAGVRVVRGHGVLAGPGRVRVGEDEYAAARGVVLNVGTSPASLPIDGLDATPYLTNREVLRLTELPASLAVVGGGAIGCELAQAFHRFGVDVTVLEAADRLLPPEEPESGELLGRVLAAEGVRVETGVRIERVDHDAAAGFVLRTDRGEVRAEQLLVAAGRRLNLQGLGLESVGLDPDARRVEVDEWLRAGERLWAIGDVTGHGQFTHVSMYQADVVVRDLLDAGGPAADHRAVSRVTFTDPEVGSVGMSEAQAREAGLDVRVALTDLADSTRGWLHGEAGHGLVKLVLDADREVLVGAASVGPTGGEVLGLLALAVHAEVPLDRLATMHHAYPTFHRAVATAVAQLREV